jgi:predicted MPP superfamily phosphohydrolase
MYITNAHFIKFVNEEKWIHSKAETNPNSQICLIMKALGLWRGKPEYPEKTTDLSQVTDKLNKMSIGDIHRCDFYYNAIAAC